MSAFDGAKISVPALRELAKRLRTRASRMRGLAEALKGAGFDDHAREADAIAGKVHADSMRTETIAIVLARYADADVGNTEPIMVGPWCTWPPAPTCQGIGTARC